ncbi:short-chain dehydrogenase/reductase SDR [Sodiomyces alkalinus F11]|uniref:Short-chain dehydrogenase/reductase SDR n=1 Tax=Sodiomyces alkalinus (strain CBS 110278 / VKM F-3762 / F11) TaxID=1314773 RepID=A0A3N2Q246_SODAK|nr:short-chain dehydrogenase/reductase SDR [Sodiomyces alkalinus F11]ROT40786.1 short-chain dehydrogenase/reductase SDR [Sodiomyces alkalinus F11]
MGTFAGFFYRQLTIKPKPLAADVRLDGKTAIVTGANVGLGLEAAKELAAHGLARLILAVRAVAKGEAAREQILAQTPGVDVQVWEVDHESFASLDAFGRRASGLDRLDIVILNAGVKNVDYVASKTGHEAHVQVNHLGTALLSVHMLAPLDRTAKALGTPGRLTIVSSENHFWAKFKERHAPHMLAELDAYRECFKGLDKMNIERYSTSKLLNVLWTRELSDRAAKLQLDVVINTVNPGFCASSLHRTDPQATTAVNLIAWTSAQGGHCIADAAALHGEVRGAYISEQKVKNPSSFVLSPAGKQTQLKLWKETVDLLAKEAPAVDALQRLNSV